MLKKISNIRYIFFQNSMDSRIDAITKQLSCVMM